MKETRFVVEEYIIYSVSMEPEFFDPVEDLVTPERLAKGDLQVVYNLRGKVSRAIPADLTIIKELIRRRVFPHYFEVYGVGFLELRAAFRAVSGVRSSAVLLEQWGVGVSNSRAGEVYQTVCKRLGSWRINVIQYVIEESKDREIEAHHSAYKDCFERLAKAMDEERERVRKEQDAFL